LHLIHIDSRQCKAVREEGLYWFGNINKSLLNEVQISISEIIFDLKSIETRREKLIRGTRDVVMLCSKSIQALHSNELPDAKLKISDARKMLDKFRDDAKDDLQRYLAVAEQELVEAYGLMSILEHSEMPNLTELNVSGPSYITGLLDSIGEIKRLVYDMLREGKSAEAVRSFSLMQELYSLIYPLSVYDNLIPGLRRKIDVSRILIEDVRSVITEEARRDTMIKSIDDLQRKLASFYSKPL
jgi:translin